MTREEWEKNKTKGREENESLRFLQTKLESFGPIDCVFKINLGSY